MLKWARDRWLVACLVPLMKTVGRPNARTFGHGRSPEFILRCGNTRISSGEAMDGWVVRAMMRVVTLAREATSQTTREPGVLE